MKSSIHYITILYIYIYIYIPAYKISHSRNSDEMQPHYSQPSRENVLNKYNEPHKSVNEAKWTGL